MVKNTNQTPRYRNKKSSLAKQDALLSYFYADIKCGWSIFFLLKSQ